MISVLLGVGADVNATADDGGTALMAAVNRGHGDVVDLLLDAGANVNAVKSTTGMTALMYGAQSGNAEVVKALVASKADVNAAVADPHWLGLATEGYVFVGIVYWCFCFLLSRVSARIERDMARGAAREART